MWPSTVPLQTLFCTFQLNCCMFKCLLQTAAATILGSAGWDRPDRLPIGGTGNLAAYLTPVIVTCARTAAVCGRLTGFKADVKTTFDNGSIT